ncbi:MAG: nitrilase-related carbon-nitrogen hydrolase [Chthoniobacterales bacterium]
MKIAVAQLACALGDVSANVCKMRDFAERAHEAGANLILFPEMSDTGYNMGVIRQEARPWSEGAVPELQEIARRHALTIVSGVSEKEGELIYNSQVVIDAEGAIIAKYRKTHLFAPAPIEEDKCCTAGISLTNIALTGFQCGLAICYDLRFPEILRALAVDQKTNVFLVSSAWPYPRVEHLRILATARAIENQSYLVLANRVGTDEGVKFCGSSAVIDPAGVIMAEARTDSEELLVAELAESEVKKVRRAMPVFSHRRQDLYTSRPKATG